MKIRSRLQLNVIISILLVLILCAVFLGAISRVSKENIKQDISIELVKNIYERATLRDEYLLHHGERSKVQWQAKQEQTERLLAQAEERFSEPDEKELLKDIRDNHRSGRSIFNSLVTNLAQSGSDEKAAIRGSELENRLANQMILKSHSMLSGALRLNEATNRDLASAQKSVAVLAIILMGLVVGVVAINSLSVNKVITKRIGKLREGAGIVGEGNLDYRIEIEGDDELSELSRAFNDSTEKRRQHRAQLVAANEELDSFAYAVSHDLRAPLRALNGFSQALVEDYGANMEGEAHVYLEQITLASKRMGDLIQGLLTLSRSTRGEFRRDSVDLSALAQRILTELAKAEPARRVEWQIEPGLAVQGDTLMIEVVMRNLLENAWKFTTRTTQPLLRVYAEEKQGERYFCVSDNGAGFDMRHKGNLFKPFQRLHRQDEFPGTGIGMATVQRILHRHGGTIDAVASPWKGATFYFSLPEAGMKKEKLDP